MRPIAAGCEVCEEEIGVPCAWAFGMNKKSSKAATAQEHMRWGILITLWVEA